MSEVESERTELPVNLAISQDVRNYVLDRTDLDPDDTFIQRVEILPEKVVVEYDDRS